MNVIKYVFLYFLFSSFFAYSQPIFYGKQVEILNIFNDHRSNKISNDELTLITKKIIKRGDLVEGWKCHVRELDVESKIFKCETPTSFPGYPFFIVKVNYSNINNPHIIGLINVGGFLALDAEVDEILLNSNLHYPKPQIDLYFTNVGRINNLALLSKKTDTEMWAPEDQLKILRISDQLPVIPSELIGTRRGAELNKTRTDYIKKLNDYMVGKKVNSWKCVVSVATVIYSCNVGGLMQIIFFNPNNADLNVYKGDVVMIGGEVMSVMAGPNKRIDIGLRLSDDPRIIRAKP